MVAREHRKAMTLPDDGYYYPPEYWEGREFIEHNYGRTEVTRWDDPNRSLMEKIISYAEDLHMVKARIFLPFFIASIGCHIANLRNQRFDTADLPNWGGKRWNRGHIFYTNKGQIVNLRLHVLYIAPSGFGKSMFLNFFMNEHTGILQRTGIPHDFTENITEAGLIGSGTVGGKEGVVKQMGLAEELPHGLFGFEEVSSIFGKKVADYNVNRENALLTALDSGRARKRTTAVKLAYSTHFTMWGGTQPTRIHMNEDTGMARRFMILNWSPNDYDREMLSDAAQHHEKANFNIINDIRAEIRRLYWGFAVDDIVFTDAYLYFRDKLAEYEGMAHPEVELLDRFAIGYNVMTNYKPGYKYLFVETSPWMEWLMMKQSRSRMAVLGRKTMEEQILSMLGASTWTSSDLKKSCRKFGISYQKAGEIIREMVKRGQIMKRKHATGGRGRPTTVYMAPESFKEKLFGVKFNGDCAVLIPHHWERGIHYDFYKGAVICYRTDADVAESFGISVRDVENEVYAFWPGPRKDNGLTPEQYERKFAQWVEDAKLSRQYQRGQPIRMWNWATSEWFAKRFKRFFAGEGAL